MNIKQAKHLATMKKTMTLRIGTMWNLGKLSSQWIRRPFSACGKASWLGVIQNLTDEVFDWLNNWSIKDYCYYRRPIPFSDRESESYLTPLPPKEKNSKAPGQIFLMKYPQNIVKYCQISSNIVKYQFGNASPSALILARNLQFPSGFDTFGERKPSKPRRRANFIKNAFEKSLKMTP